MKRLIAIALCVVFIITGTTVPVQAEEGQETIWYSDGSCLEITVTGLDTRATGVKTRSKTYTFRDNESSIDWQITLTATFTYDGTTSKATDAQCSVTIYDDAWSVVTKYAVRAGVMAEGHVTLSRSVLGMEVERPCYVVTLECDAEGNIS